MGSTENPTLWTRYRLNRCSYNGVRLYFDPRVTSGPRKLFEEILNLFKCYLAHRPTPPP